MECYFKSVLPSATGQLAKVVPNSIKEANKAVHMVLSKESASRKRQEYQKVSTEMKSKIAKYAAENGVKAAVTKFEDQVPNAPQNWKNTVRDWKDAYLLELKRKRSAGDISDVVLLPSKKIGRPLLLGDELDKQVQAYITSLRSGHAVVNTTIVLALAEGIIKGNDPGLLASNGGSIELTRDWAKSIMKRMGLSKCKATTKSNLLQYDFDKVHEIYLNDIASILVMEDIPLPLIINWDQTGTNYVLVSEWTMEVKGAKRVEIGGLNDKRMMTAVLAGTAGGEFLPPQLIYSGSTVKSLLGTCPTTISSLRTATACKS